MEGHNILTIDVEDWFHILDTPAVPPISEWSSLDSRIDRNVNILFDLLAQYNIKATMFWLGWVAERNKNLIRKCYAAGHEIASHGYAHVLAYKVGRKVFGQDIRKGKALLEDIVGDEVKGFRAAGFSTKNDTKWTFSEINQAGYKYDSSIFPSSRGHGGMSDSKMEPHFIQTEHGELLEFPQSMISFFGKRLSLFGGGYLRIFPLMLIRYGIKLLHKENRPFILYVHPREVDPDHPRWPLTLPRRFKSYCNLRSTLPKLEWCCKHLSFITMAELTKNYTKGEF